MPSSTLHTGHRDTINLGRRIGGGGEGQVFEVAGNPALVAKLYPKPNLERGRKVALMARIATPDLLKVAAWPTDTLHSGPGGVCVGLLMPRIRDGRAIHCLYNPAERKRVFPQADWTFLIHAARNIADAFATVHAHHCVIGDVNQGNVFVTPKAEARFIDCDSYQITMNGDRFLCEVGVGHFTPPELQVRGFAGVVRTPNHDAFGLAILIFHLLFMGRHPFAGRYHGRGDMPIEEAIKGFRFAFGQQAAARQMSPPPLALTLAQIAQPMAVLFERAFSPGGAQGPRPTPAEWVTALDHFRQQLRPCSLYSGHKYFTRLPKCIWCELEQQGAPDFFITVAAVTTTSVTSGFNLTAVWDQIAAVGLASPADFPTPQPGTYTGTPLPIPARLVRLATWLAGIGALGALLGTVAGASGSIAPFWILLTTWIALCAKSPHRAEAERRTQAVKLIQADLRAAQERWTREVDGLATAYRTKLADLERAKRDYQDLPAHQRREERRLHEERERNQRIHFLERFYISHDKIDGIGPGRTALLVSFGIETAADVTRGRLEPVPGFGPVLTQKLLEWRRQHEARFRFDPAKGVDPADVAALKKRIDAKRRDLETTLTAGVRELQQAKARLEATRRNFGAYVATLQARLGQAQADARA